MAIKIHGLKAAADNAKTNAPASPFPAAPNSAKYGLKHTARVDKVSIKTDESPRANDQLELQVSNGGYSSRIWLQLDPTIIPPTVAQKGDEDINKFADRTLAALGKACKILDLLDANGDLDEKRFKAAVGKLVTISVQESGTKNDKGYTRLWVNLLGDAAELVPVVAPTSAPAPTSAGGYDDDIPF